jgi:hypothetical protein
MNTVWIVLLVIYALGILPTYLYFDKKTDQSMFSKVWFSYFWPAAALFAVVYYSVVLIKKFKK